MAARRAATVAVTMLVGVVGACATPPKAPGGTAGPSTPTVQTLPPSPAIGEDLFDWCEVGAWAIGSLSEEWVWLDLLDGEEPILLEYATAYQPPPWIDVVDVYRDDGVLDRTLRRSSCPPVDLLYGELIPAGMALDVKVSVRTRYELVGEDALVLLEDTEGTVHPMDLHTVRPLMR
jgi:hypothetical protein